MDQPGIITLDTPSLGDRSYLVHDGTVAAVIDPQRDLDRVLDAAREAGVRITHVLETHIHNDYVTGGLALARETGADYLVNAADDVAFDRTPVSDGESVAVGERMRLRAVATPGHTFTHLSYVLTWDGEDLAVFSGGSMLFGATGRPDLLGPEHTDALVRHQFESAHRLAAQLPDDAQVMPTHGFGSFCSSGSTGGVEESTIGRERRENPVLTDDEERWIADTLDGLDEFPAYYAHMGPANSAGPAAADLTPPAVADRDAIARSLAAGDWVVDLRNRTAYADRHAVGTLNLGLDGQFATYVGWLIPWGTPLTLLGESAEQVAEAQRELVRIGIDRLAGHALGGPDDWSEQTGSFPRADFATLGDVRHHRDVTVLDVRRAKEFAAGHLDGAVHVPLHHLLDRLGEVPEGEIWVHCASGYRASIAASILAAAGRRVVAIDDSFNEHADAAGMPLVSAA